jgi:hypothetical protein
VRFPLFWAGFCLCLGACGPKLPPRYVIESDLDGYGYRRYQQVLDVEFPVEGNPSVAHTATYVRGGESLQVAPVVVTTYERAAGLTETVRQRLRSMDGYTLDVTKVDGDNVWRMKGAAGDQWMVWVSNSQLVKVGAPDGASEVPAVIVEKYLDVYPSDLDDKGKAKEGRASAGSATTSSSGEAAPTKTEEGAAP